MKHIEPTYINLSHLDKPMTGPYRIFFLISGFILLLISASILKKNVQGEESIFNYLVVGTYLLIALHNFWVSYSGNRNLFLRLKAFVAIDQEKIVYKPTFFSKSKTLFWRDVQKIDIQLFALIFELTNGKKTTFSLDPIDSDDDVKAIKDRVGTIATLKVDASDIPSYR